VIEARQAAGVCWALLLTAAPPRRLLAQVSLKPSVGLRYTSTLVHDSIVAPFDVRPALAPVVALALATPLEPGWTFEAALDFSTAGLERHDADGRTAGLGRVSTFTFTVGVRRRFGGGFTAAVGAGGIKDVPAEATGIFRAGASPVAALVALSIDYALPLAPRAGLALEARYDVHGFTTPALRAEGFASSRLVHRVALGLRALWPHRGAAPA
jgi:hypothetical protein